MVARARLGYGNKSLFILTLNHIPNEPENHNDEWCTVHGVGSHFQTDEIIDKECGIWFFRCNKHTNARNIHISNESTANIEASQYERKIEENQLEPFAECYTDERFGTNDINYAYFRSAFFASAADAADALHSICGVDETRQPNRILVRIMNSFGVDTDHPALNNYIASRSKRKMKKKLVTISISVAVGMDGFLCRLICDSCNSFCHFRLWILLDKCFSQQFYRFERINEAYFMCKLLTRTKSHFHIFYSSFGFCLSFFHRCRANLMLCHCPWLIVGVCVCVCDFFSVVVCHNDNELKNQRQI